jgi:hypothetical protein
MALDRDGLEEKKLEEGLMETAKLAEHTLYDEVLAASPEYTEKPALHETPSVDDTGVLAQETEVDGDNEEHDDSVDQEEEEDSDWSERDYEEDSEESDWDSEDDSDYEDDWEAEYGFGLPKAEPVKDIPVLSSGVVVPGRSLLDF